MILFVSNMLAKKRQTPTYDFLITYHLSIIVNQQIANAKQLWQYIK